MKLFIKSLCIAFVISVICSMLPFQAECSQIPNEVFRLHIMANSDSELDQALKLKVRDKVLKSTENLFKQARSRREAERIVSDNLQSIANLAYAEVIKNGFDYPVKAEVTKMYFNTRYYESYTLPAGNYDALRITIGEGAGHNWWCVMYPSICISSKEEQDEKAKEAFSDEQYKLVKNEKCEYKFKIVEIFEKICSFFS